LANEFKTIIAHRCVGKRGRERGFKGGLTPSCSTPLADKWQAQGPQKRERGRRPPFHWTWAQ